MASCFGTKGGGSDAIYDIVAYAAANYPGRLGFMNAGLNAVGGGGWADIIFDNRATNQEGPNSSHGRPIPAVLHY